MKGYAFHKVYFIQCAICNENIVERADELMVQTLADAQQYAREHHTYEHADQPVTLADHTASAIETILGA